MSGHSREEVTKQVRSYIIVFALLGILTIVTVAVSYLHLSLPIAVAVALFVASLKGSLVAAYFMHLISEKKIITWILILTAFFLIVLLVLPVLAEF